MLAVLLVKMEWDKNSRTPAGSAERQEYFNPVKIEDNVNLEGEGIFLKKCQYYQSREGVISRQQLYDGLNKKNGHESETGAFLGIDWKKERQLSIQLQEMRREQGSFWKEEDIDIPCIAIEKKEENVYQIKWFDYGRGMPRRRGGNEDFYKKGKKLRGQPNVRNETAFILGEGQSGVLKYNYRYTSYSGQWYVCYYVYMVNDTVLTQDTFLRTYDYEYSQLADLF